MPLSPNLRESVRKAKQLLSEGREKVRERHRAGSPGIQVSNALTDLADEVLVGLYESALEELDPDGRRGLAAQAALVAHGGYGRRDVAPFSDVDLMLLHAPGADDVVAPLAQRLLRDVYDSGLELGHSVRTVRQALAYARGDATIASSLVEHRLLVGSAELYEKFAQKFRQQCRRRWRSLLPAFEEARREERVQFGETIYLLEPNVKRSQGGLRDIQLLRWVGFVRYGSQAPDNLKRMGLLTSEEYGQLVDARDFLLRLRNELHFHAGKSADLLDKAEQVRLAEWFGIDGDEGGLLPVEAFMRAYFLRTGNVSRILDRFLANAQPRSRVKSALVPLVSHQVEGDFRAGPTHISATRRGAAKLGSLEEILRLADLANYYDKAIAHDTCEIVREAVPELGCEVSEEAARRFLSLLSQPARLEELLEQLHALGVLEKVIPEFRHARGLLQFNEYHKYTVDVHSIRAVGCSIDFLEDDGPVGRVYRGIKNKALLHLAALIHDLGKGYAEDHSELGRGIAQRTAERLRLPPAQAAILEFLVHKHLLMSHTAFRRDFSEEKVLVEFAVEVGSPEVLQMLLVLTAADFSAVGPDVWNDWKAEVLSQLYHLAMQRLSGGNGDLTRDDVLETRRGVVRECVTPNDAPDWFRRQIAALPRGYLASTPPEQIAVELRRLRSLEPGEVFAEGRWLENSRTIEYTIATFESVAPGIFHKLTGALTRQGKEILSAEIYTLADGVVLDRFTVEDPDYEGEPPPERIEAVQEALRASLTSPDDGQPMYRKVWGSTSRRERVALANIDTRVRIDNSTSPTCTVLDIFTADRPGLLYCIGRTVFELGLSVSLAKIGTYATQVVDIIYVTDEHGHKVEDDARLAEIRERLLQAIAEHARECEAVGM